ncbi:MAG: hypothetical protein DRP67_00075 [Candidatus Omnitrophota bacterium]|nr:MAG: hypothetical protein DRP67_00075 [Candidatus Omnitrophota bacterium]HDN97765.1 serine/threonine protein kinase [bacterium]
MKVRSGFVVKGYRLEEMVGSGGFSTVYKATSVTLNPPFGNVIAVKVLHPRRIEKEQIKRFKNEAHIAMSLEHENIVKVYDFVEYEGNFFIFMELLDIDLNKMIKTKKEVFTFEKIIEILKKSALGLSYLHKKGIIHKDFNPSNILLSYSLKKVKITDFGLARKKRFIFWKNPPSSGGTRGYIAPEVYQGRIDKRVDIYSFGKSMENIFSQLNFPITNEISHIIEVSTKEDPKERFQDMDEIIYLLNRIENGKRV